MRHVGSSPQPAKFKVRLLDRLQGRKEAFWVAFRTCERLVFTKAFNRPFTGRRQMYHQGWRSAGWGSVSRQNFRLGDTRAISSMDNIWY
jgi:hypothetical protein